MRKLNQKGFTIVELMLYVALMSVLLVVLTEVLVSLLAVKLESEASLAADSDGRYILARLNYDIGRMLPTDSITTPLALGSSSNTLSFTINGQPITYALIGDNLQLDDGGPVGNLNSSESGVSQQDSDLIFRKIGNPGGKQAIKVEYRVTSRTRRQTGFEIRNYQTTIGRR